MGFLLRLLRSMTFERYFVSRLNEKEESFRSGHVSVVADTKLQLRHEAAVGLKAVHFRPTGCQQPPSPEKRPLRGYIPPDLLREDIKAVVHSTTGGGPSGLVWCYKHHISQIATVQRSSSAEASAGEHGETQETQYSSTEFGRRTRESRDIRCQSKPHQLLVSVCRVNVHHARMTFGGVIK